jgi:hypothetical protein
MAHLWVIGASQQWDAIVLDADSYVFDDASPCLLARDVNAASHAHLVTLRRSARGAGGSWVLLTPPQVNVMLNGMAIHTGLAVLADHDEIRLPNRPAMFFSTEVLARVAPYPLESAKGFCPRCKQPIGPGDPAVQCPACSLWHHATDTLPCWTYAEHCAACPQPTASDTGFRWTPEEL